MRKYDQGVGLSSFFEVVMMNLHYRLFHQKKVEEELQVC
jgi:hypothetical protein